MPPTWKDSLHRLLSQRAADIGRPPRVAVLGIGNTLRSDDAAGTLVARALLSRLSELNHQDWLILETGPAPENSTGELRRFAPDLVLFVDAAAMGDSPGHIRWVPEEAIGGMSASTHGLPLPILARYLKLELGCEVRLLGIQAFFNDVGEHVHPAVLQAVEEAVQGLIEVIQSQTGRAQSQNP